METELPTGSQSTLRSFREKPFARCPAEMISQCASRVRAGSPLTQTHGYVGIDKSPHFAELLKVFAFAIRLSQLCYSSLSFEASTSIITFGIDYVSTFEIKQQYYTKEDADSQEGWDFAKDVLLFGDKVGG